MQTKIKHCLECGIPFTVEARAGNTTGFCGLPCQTKRRRRQVAAAVRRHRQREEARKYGYKLPA